LGIACSWCERGGRYRLETLIARHGPNFSIPLLLELLSADCAKRESLSAYDLCGIHAPELSGLFMARPGRKPEGLGDVPASG
jgi:hypothetical protein